MNNIEIRRKSINKNHPSLRKYEVWGCNEETQIPTLLHISFNESAAFQFCTSLGCTANEIKTNF